jgi:leucyl aminopeptidase (aminopeptidase T)
MDSLDTAANNILKVCMGLNKSESFLVVYDRNKKDIAEIILEKANKICKTASKIETKVGKVSGEEPPNDIAKEIKKYDVVVMVTTKSLSHTDARRNACKNGTRVASMPGISIDMMKRTLTADYSKIKKKNEKIRRVFQKGNKLRLVTAKGSDLIMYLNNELFNDDGFYHKKGDFGNLPAGEVGFAPVEGKTSGVVVIDESMAGFGKLNENMIMEIEKGFVKNITGGKKTKELVKLLKKFKDKNVYNIAEFAIGTNYKAKITGKILEDEKVDGTVHIAIGDNSSFGGGKTNAPVHLDGVISKPTVFVDGKKIMDNGRLLL